MRETRMLEAARVSEYIGSMSNAMHTLLQRSIQIPSISGQEAAFVHEIEQWSRREGFVADMWESQETQLPPPPWPMTRHLPLAGRPTLLIRLPGRGTGPSVIFNAHSDVVDAPKEQAWRFGPWSGAEEAGVIYGRGACDVKGPLISALWAMKALQRSFPEKLDGDVLLELVPGEEDCVGLGTLTSLARNYGADAAIILEPTETLPRCASRGGCRFEVLARGRAVHGTVKWLGRDAIAAMRIVLGAIDRLEARWNAEEGDALFRPYPILRPMTVDAIHGGRWQGMVCDLCTCAGYLELLPGDPLEASKKRFVEDLQAEVLRLGDLTVEDIQVCFSEEYGGHSTSPEDDLCRVAEEVVRSHGSAGSTFRWVGFNSGCEAGLRHAVQKTPTLVWGPGTLANAHAADESVVFQDVESVARLLALFCLSWAGSE